MRKFLIMICTIFITMILILFGIVSNMENIMIDTMDTVIQKEIQNNLTDYLKENTDYNVENIQKGVHELLEENVIIKTTLHNYMNKFFDIIMSDETEEININNEVEQLIKDSESILKDYGITLKEEDKKEILNAISSEEMNYTINKEIKEFKNSINGETKTAIQIYSFIRSTTFKFILISVLIVLLIIIAFLQKSYYKWLGTFGWSSIISGIFIGILIPTLLDYISRNLMSDNLVVISLSSLNIYGYTLLAIGVISVVVKIGIQKFLLKEEKNEGE